MGKIINVAPYWKHKKRKPNSYGLSFEHSFNLKAEVKGDYENRDDENEQKAIEQTIRYFEELLDMWRSGDLDETIEDARMFREID